MAYAGEPVARGNVEVDRRVQNFFVECYHLRDWLGRDARSRISLPSVDKFIEHSQPLARCQAFCNTHKHHTRRPGQMEARIRDTYTGPDGARVTIEIDWASPQAERVDAFDLANDCIESWRAFFRDFGVNEP